MLLTNFFRRKSDNHYPISKSSSITTKQLLLILNSQIFKKLESKLGERIKILGFPPTTQSSDQEIIEYSTKLYDILLQKFGTEVAKKTFEVELENIKTTYSSTEYFQLLKELPVPVMIAEKLALLNREELEEELISRIQELENIKLNLEKIVTQRTQFITAEKNKLALILSGITDAVIALDLNYNAVSFNRSAEYLTGLNQSTVSGKPITQLIKLFDKGREINVSEFAPIRNDGFEGETLQMEGLRMVSSTNKESFINLRVGQIREGNIVNLGCILTLYDVTKEKQLEEMKMDFVSMAAHELRTPLTAIKGYLQVFLRATQNLTSQQQTFLFRINISAHKLIALVENLLNVSKIERGAITLQLEEVDWFENIKVLTQEFLDQVKDKNQEFTLVTPTTTLPKLKVDKLRMNEVLSNLLSNAVSYTPIKGTIKVWFEVSDSEVTTHIQDNGPGIPKEALPHLFTKFFRVSGKLKQGSNGTGLGLYIAKSIIELHKGKIWVESEEDKGSTFSFSIPINQ